MGKKSAELLLGRIKGKPASETIVFEPELVIRRSTATPKS
jgi:DNA-binding LacI/PurR family transcriptional regulator